MENSGIKLNLSTFTNILTEFFNRIVYCKNKIAKEQSFLFSSMERMPMRKKLIVLVTDIVLFVALATWATINWLAAAGGGSECSV